MFGLIDLSYGLTTSNYIKMNMHGGEYTKFIETRHGNGAYNMFQFITRILSFWRVPPLAFSVSAAYKSSNSRQTTDPFHAQFLRLEHHWVGSREKHVLHPCEGNTYLYKVAIGEKNEGKFWFSWIFNRNF